MAERKKLIDMVNATLMNAKSSTNFHSEALLTTYHVYNRIPLRKSEVSLYELRKNRTPSLEIFSLL